MNKNIMSPGEVNTATANLRAIEKNLGHTVSRGLLDYSELGDHLYSPGEVNRVCQNLREVEKSKGLNEFQSCGNAAIDLLVLLLWLIIGIIRIVSKFIKSLFSSS